MNVLFLSYDGLTDNLGQSQILPYVNGLAAEGYRMHVITVDKPEFLTSRKELVQKNLDRSISWHSLVYHKNPPLFSTFWDLFRMRRKAIAVVSKYDIDIIHVRSYPPMTIALSLKRRFGVRILFDMRGFYADERLEGEIWRQSNPVHRYAFNRIKRLEKKFFSKSDHIISLTKNAKDLLIRDYGINETKITVIPCCADFEHFSLSKKSSENNEFNIVYLGSLGTWYLIPELLSLFKRIQQFHTNAHLHVLTADDSSIIETLRSELAIPKDSLTVRSAERSELPSLLSQMHLSIFLIKESFSKRASSPTKLAELMACGVPVLCNSGVGDLATLSSKYDGLEAHSLESLKTEALEPILSKLLSISPSVIRTQAQENLSLSVAINRYSRVYRAILD